MKRVFYVGMLCTICVLFIFYRIPSLLAHYVAYTFDQGRDFIAASNIILNHKIPFIGPTTGINGLFHGAWWYYLLSIPYLIFNGVPIGYYWFDFFIQFTCLIVLMLFLKKEFGYLISLLFGLFIALAPYFTLMSLFAGNNSMVLPSLLIFLICNYYLFKNKQVSLLLLFITGLSLALVSEFELSFGIFLIPLYIGAIFLFPSLRKILLHKRGFLFLFGVVVGFLPRILFELKNAFMQSKVLLSFFLHPNLLNSPTSYSSRVNERWILFKTYYFEMFANRYFAHIFLVSIIVITFITVISVIQKKSKNQSIFFFYSYLLGGLFFLSTLYKDFFWKNYYEGIHYIFIFIFISLMGQIVHKRYIVVKRAILFSLILGFVILNIVNVRGSLTNKVPFDGLQVNEAVVNYILRNQDLDKKYCVRIYTPSVIPHTYNYLFLIHKMKPSNECAQDTCWFIVEPDNYKKRRDEWERINEPKDPHTVVVKIIKDIEIRYYKVLPK